MNIDVLTELVLSEPIISFGNEYTDNMAYITRRSWDNKFMVSDNML